MSSGTSIKGYRPVVADKTGKLPPGAEEEMAMDENTRQRKMAELLVASEKMTPAERLFQPNPPWLRISIHGDLIARFDEEDLPQVNRRSLILP